jgi:putative transposase
MTHQPQTNERDATFQQESWPDEVPSSWNDLLDLMSDRGFDGMARAMQVLFNEAMKLERSAVLGAGPFERTPQRRGQANGFKPKTVETRLGALELRVPQTRGVPFYPSSLEKGQRSERALKLAIAEMYLQGVSTRKVTAVMEELCGLEVTSSQVSRAVRSGRGTDEVA